jgi:hypothetical protein
MATAHKRDSTVQKMIKLVCLRCKEKTDPFHRRSYHTKYLVFKEILKKSKSMMFHFKKINCSG